MKTFNISVPTWPADLAAAGLQFGLSGDALLAKIGSYYDYIARMEGLMPGASAGEWQGTDAQFAEVLRALPAWASPYATTVDALRAKAAGGGGSGPPPRPQ